MSYKGMYKIISNKLIAYDVYEMVIQGDTTLINKPGQFINIKINDGIEPFLRRPISVCDYDEDTITLIYKVVGEGTKLLSKKQIGDELDCLVGLGNGFNISKVDGDNILVVGGGVGVPPMYKLVKDLREKDYKVTVVLGFNSKQDIFYEDKFKELTDNVYISTVTGDYGIKGFVTDLINQKKIEFDYYMTCGPEAMLKALLKYEKEGQLSFEERMGCGFGACMGCSCKTLTGYKRICVEGPILYSNEVIR